MIQTRPGNTDIDTKTTKKSTVLKPIENTSFVSISSPKLKVYKQDDGILCKLIYIVFSHENIYWISKGLININQHH